MMQTHMTKMDHPLKHHQWTRSIEFLSALLLIPSTIQAIRPNSTEFLQTVRSFKALALDNCLEIKQKALTIKFINEMARGKK